MNIVVTGASRGIGNALVKHLVMQHNCQVLAISRNDIKLKALEDGCKIGGKGSLFTLAADLTDDDLELKLSPFFKKNFERLDLLINNAGFLVNKPFLSLTKEDFNKSYHANVYAIIRLIQLAHQPLKNSQNGHVVNIGSMGGVMGSSKFPGLSVYSSSKGAVSILTECLAEEFKNEGISFNCLALGAVQTEMLNEAFPGYKAPVNPEEMSRFIADFGMKAHQFINGKVIPVSLSNP